MLDMEDIEGMGLTLKQSFRLFRIVVVSSKS